MIVMIPLECGDICPGEFIFLRGFFPYDVCDNCSESFRRSVMQILQINKFSFNFPILYLLLDLSTRNP